MSRLAALLAVSIGALLAGSRAAADTLVSLENEALDEVRVVGFELDRPADVEVDAVGMRPYDAGELTAYAWILNAATRRPVWVMEARGTSRVDRSEILRRAQKRLRL